jgi:hypothetical protein
MAFEIFGKPCPQNAYASLLRMGLCFTGKLCGVFEPG